MEKKKVHKAELETAAALQGAHTNLLRYHGLFQTTLLRCGTGHESHTPVPSTVNVVVAV